MITYTGRYVWPERGSPSLIDIGIGLSRIPRFAGATKEWYSVLSHSIVVAKLLPPELRAYGLLHDAAECVVSDIPQPWKTEAQKRSEAIVTRRIYRELGLKVPTREQNKAIKRADIIALHAEAYVLGHAEPDWFCNEEEVDNMALLMTEVELLCDPRWIGIDAKLIGGWYSNEVKKYLKLVPESFFRSIELKN